MSKIKWFVRAIQYSFIVAAGLMVYIYGLDALGTLIDDTIDS